MNFSVQPGMLLIKFSQVQEKERRLCWKIDINLFLWLMIADSFIKKKSTCSIQSHPHSEKDFFFEKMYLACDQEIYLTSFLSKITVLDSI